MNQIIKQSKHFIYICHICYIGHKDDRNGNNVSFISENPVSVSEFSKLDEISRV